VKPSCTLAAAWEHARAGFAEQQPNSSLVGNRPMRARRCIPPQFRSFLRKQDPPTLASS